MFKKIVPIVLGLVGMLGLTGCASVTDTVGRAVTSVYTVIGIVWVFWPVFLLSTLFLSWFTEEVDNPVANFIFVAFFLWLFHGALQLDAIGFIRGHEVLFAAEVASYIVVGIVWSVLKLRIAGRKRSEKFAAKKKEYIDRGFSEDEWIKQLATGGIRFGSEYYGAESGIETSIDSFKPRIFRWIAYWPYSMTWFVLSDFVKHVLEFIYRYLKQLYVWAYQSTIGNILSDMEKVREYQQRTSHEERSRKDW